MGMPNGVIDYDLHRQRKDQDAEYHDKMRSILCRRGGVRDSVGPAMILDHLYLGNMKDAHNTRLLNRLKITHVINCAGKDRDYSKQIKEDKAAGPYDGSDTGVMGYLQFEAFDNEDYPILMHYTKAKAFINEARRDNGRVLIHCEMGVNRSAALCIAYMMEDQSLTLMQALRMVKMDRQVLLTNEGFRKQLIQFARDRDLMYRKKPQK